MNSFKRSLFGYRRPEVDAAMTARDVEIAGLRLRATEHADAIGAVESEMSELSGMVIEREREIRVLGERLREANECHDRSIASLDAVSARLEDLQAQARGQATRIRMKALREAVEVSKRVQALTEASTAEVEDAPAEESAAVEDLPIATSEPAPVTNGNGHSNGNGSANGNGHALFAGDLKLEIGPLGDFSQLVGFEDAVGRAGASDISVERFSEGRATLSMHLEEPTDLLRELEDLSILDFKVRHTAPDSLVLDIDDEADPTAHAA